MRAIKSVAQTYTVSEDLLRLLDGFRKMVNTCVDIGLITGVTSLKSLSVVAYPRLASFNIPSYYKLCAISHATGILRNYRKSLRRNPKTRRPYSRRLTLRTCYGFKIIHGALRLPIKPRVHANIPLNSHTVNVLSEPHLTVRSVSFTASKLNITFSKDTIEMEPAGLVGLDRNLNNITTVSTDCSIVRYDLSRATDIGSKYRFVRSRYRRNDFRIKRRIYAKYGLKQRNKTLQLVHHVSKEIVQNARAQKLGIVMEKLTGLRRLYCRGNFQRRAFRAKMHSWSYGELQRQIEYKARWEGAKVIYVDARGTSVTCSMCGSRTHPNGQRTLYCPKCNISTDRDVNAARSILARGLRFGPIALPTEAMVQEPSRGNPESRWE